MDTYRSTHLHYTAVSIYQSMNNKVAHHNVWNWVFSPSLQGSYVYM